MDRKFSVLVTRLIAGFVVVLLSACGGGGSGFGDNSPGSKISAASKAVSVSLSASQTQINAGQSVTLSWSSANASSCTASGGWGGSKSVTGSEVLSNLQRSADYMISCTDVVGAGAVSGVSIQVGTDKSLRIEFTAQPANVREAERSALTWKAFNAERCRASGDWSGDRPLEGQFDTGALVKKATFTLECSKAEVKELATVTVTVGAVIIQWQAPTLNEDGSRADDIAGYKVYWGRQADQTDGSTTINDPLQTSWKPDLPAGKYYFSVSAFDDFGNESERSPAILKELS